MIGPPEDDTARTLQYVGITASLLSITKGCAEWWVRSRDANYFAFDFDFVTRDAPISKTLQASMYFLPHILFRTSALAFAAAFLGYYSLIPTISAILVVFCLCWNHRADEDDDDEGGWTCIATVFAPIALAAGSPYSRTLMKRGITIFTTILLLSLTFIRLLPVMVHPDNLVSTYGLRHLNFAKPSGVPTFVVIFL